MKTKDVVSKLRLMASTIEELEIDNIINCEIGSEEKMTCHLPQLKLSNDDGIWTERYTFNYPWEKSFTYNNIRFFSLYTQEEYDKEK